MFHVRHSKQLLSNAYIIYLLQPLVLIQKKCESNRLIPENTVLIEIHCAFHLNFIHTVLAIALTQSLNERTISEKSKLGMENKSNVFPKISYFIEFERCAFQYQEILRQWNTIRWNTFINKELFMFMCLLNFSFRSCQHPIYFRLLSPRAQSN